MKSLPPGWAALLILFWLGAAAMAVLMPPYENPDERGHFCQAVYWEAKLLERDHRLAHQARIIARQEKFQTPLYYLSLAPVVWLSDFHGPLAFPSIDPEFRCQPVPPGQGPHRRYRPLSGLDQRGAVRAMYAMRATSLLWGLGAVLLGLGLFWELSNRDPALTLAAGALWALNPRWLETCASVGNDVAATALAGLALYALTRTLRAADPPSLWRAALLGALCALAAYAKMNAVALAGVCAGALFLGGRAWGLSWVRCLALAAAAAASTLLLLAPWLARNYAVFGDALLVERSLWAPYVATRQAVMYPWDFFREEFEGFRWSYYAVYGQFGLLMHHAAYRVLDALLVVSGLLGLAFWTKCIWHGPDFRERLVQCLAPAWLLLAFGAFLIYNSGVYASQGRLLYPAGWALAYLQAGGLLLLVPRAKRSVAAWAVLGGMTFWDLYVFFGVIWPGFSYLSL
ncbi:MAG: hypothetical protein KQH53_16185 [Desulfarculaceae bacterium]|nr:hypothetical protein [Desulfarculaceae bacterium]